MQNLDTQKLRYAIRKFETSSKPTSASHNTEATVGDIHKLIRGVSEVLSEFVNELEN